MRIGYECAKDLLQNKEVELLSIFCYPAEYKDRSGYVDFYPLNPFVKIIKTDINNPENIELVSNLKPDLIVVIGYSFLISEKILKIPSLGVIGHHPTLLPKHRGNAPIPWTLINGLVESGVTFFFLEKEIDQGKIALQKKFKISLKDDAAMLYEKITRVTIKLLRELISKTKSKSLQPFEQDPLRASKWQKRKPEDGIIDWGSMTIYLYNWIRALTKPYPGAFTFLKNKKLYIWKCEINNKKNYRGKPGQIVDIVGDVIVVKTGDGAINLIDFQIEEETGTQILINKYKIKKGIFLG